MFFGFFQIFSLMFSLFMFGITIYLIILMIKALKKYLETDTQQLMRRLDRLEQEVDRLSREKAE